MRSSCSPAPRPSINQHEASLAMPTSGRASLLARPSAPPTRDAGIDGAAMSAVALPRRFASLVKIEHTVFALPFAYIGALLCRNEIPSLHDLVWITLAMVGARSLAMSINRLADAEIDARAPRGAPLARASRHVLRPGARALPARVLPARSDRALARADPDHRLRRLPVPEAVHVAEPPLARRGRRARACRRVGGDHRRAPFGGVGARRRRGSLDRRLRPLLLAVRPRRRRRAGPSLG